MVGGIANTKELARGGAHKKRVNTEEAGGGKGFWASPDGQSEIIPTGLPVQFVRHRSVNISKSAPDGTAQLHSRQLENKTQGKSRHSKAKAKVKAKRA